MVTVLSYRLVFTALTLILSACFAPAGAVNSDMMANNVIGTDVNAAAGKRGPVALDIALPQNCPGEDYSPCTCTTEGNYEVTCHRIPLEQVQAVLSQSVTRDWYGLSITAIDNYFSENITGGVSVTSLSISDFPTELPPATLKCNPKAFTSTETRTQIFNLIRWDLSEHDYTYLGNFTELQWLLVASSVGFLNSWHTLPALPKLTTLDVTACPSMGNSDMVPLELPSLEQAIFTDNNLDGTKVASILDGLLSASPNSLGYIDFSMNLLTTIPSGFTSFPNLYTIRFSDNFFSHLPAGSINFPDRTLNVDLRNCAVETIEPGAFIGYLGDVGIALNGNLLSRLEEDVFHDILQQMAAPRKTGFVDLDSNPIDCDTDICHLEWLIVTNPELLKPIRNGKCSNGTRFEDLDATAISRACSKELTSTELTTELTTNMPTITSTFASVITTRERVDEVETTKKAGMTSSSPWMTSYITSSPTLSSTIVTTSSTDVHEDMTSSSLKATAASISSSKPSAGSSAVQYSTVLMLMIMSWIMLIAVAADAAY